MSSGKNNVVDVTDADGLTAWLVTEPQAAHVVFFHADFDEASKPGGQMDVVIDKLAQLHSGVKFAKVRSSP
jgi:hypothetical protein